jgi:hypothetical protein
VIKFVMPEATVTLVRTCFINYVLLSSFSFVSCLKLTLLHHNFLGATLTAMTLVTHNVLKDEDDELPPVVPNVVAVA